MCGEMNLIFLLYGGERKSTGKIDDALRGRTASHCVEWPRFITDEICMEIDAPNPARSWGISRHRNHTKTISIFKQIILSHRENLGVCVCLFLVLSIRTNQWIMHDWFGSIGKYEYKSSIHARCVTHVIQINWA